MKCLVLEGDMALAERFAGGMAEALPERVVGIVRGNGRDGFSVSYPGISSMTRLLDSMSPELVLVMGDMGLAAPVVWCGGEPREDLRPLVLEVWDGKPGSLDYQAVCGAVFELLPQRSEEECGRCGLDCRGLAEAILKGTRKPGDCCFAHGRVEITRDGRKMELGEFPARAVDGTVRGLLSSFKGYREGSSITIRLEGSS